VVVAVVVNAKVVAGVGVVVARTRAVLHLLPPLLMQRLPKLPPPKPLLLRLLHPDVISSRTLKPDTKNVAAVASAKVVAEVGAVVVKARAVLQAVRHHPLLLFPKQPPLRQHLLLLRVRPLKLLLPDVHSLKLSRPDTRNVVAVASAKVVAEVGDVVARVRVVPEEALLEVLHQLVAPRPLLFPLLLKPHPPKECLHLPKLHPLRHLLPVATCSRIS
jgi:hypothetical protein